jgi:serine protease SohB
MVFLDNWGLFFAKSFSLLALILIFLVLFLAIAGKAKMKARSGELEVKSLAEQLEEQQLSLWQETLSKKALKSKLKAFKKAQKQAEKKKTKTSEPRLFVLNFKGDMQAGEASNLSKEVTALLQMVEHKDEVLVRIESPGGVVQNYGYAASQLQRIRNHKIKLTVAVDKVAASGGYLMACVADQIIAAPFAIIGSIGVVAQVPNFHRWLDKKGIDFEQLYAGEYKRTITMFGKNTKEGRAKFEEQLEDIHAIFKDFIKEHRPQVDLKKVATGEHWLASDALKLKLVDRLETSDDYVLAAFNEGRALFEINFMQKKSLKAKLGNSMNMVIEKLSAPRLPF